MAVTAVVMAATVAVDAAAALLVMAMGVVADLEEVHARQIQASPVKTQATVKALVSHVKPKRHDSATSSSVMTRELHKTTGTSHATTSKTNNRQATPHRGFRHRANRQAIATTISVMAVLAAVAAAAVTQVAVAMARVGLVARVRFLVDKFALRLPIVEWVAA